MTYSKIQHNIEKILTLKQIEVEELYQLAGINSYELEKLLSSALVSLDNQILNKIANALNCSASDLLSDVKKKKTLNQRVYHKKKSKELLSSFSKINIDLLSDSVAKVDEIISSEGKNINTYQRVMAYLAFYELADNFIKKS